MDEMADAAHRSYRRLVYETPGFLEYWEYVTPLEEIKRLYIGSRPAARQVNPSGARPAAPGSLSIRAIPWVFSWMQSRFNLPGWYGLGCGLAASSSTTRLQEMYQDWAFFKALLDNAEMSLLKADMEIAGLYSALVPDQVMARRLFALILDEYQRTRDWILQVTGHRELMQNEPLVARSVQLRNPYVDPLNYLQVEMLRRLRSLQQTERALQQTERALQQTERALQSPDRTADADTAEGKAIREVIVITINGIASGLRNTG
jgi:phosphoenolpyruvate carboxylase